MQKQYYYTVLTEEMRRNGIEYKENETYIVDAEDSMFKDYENIFCYKTLEDTMCIDSKGSDRIFLIEVEYAKIYMSHADQLFFDIQELNKIYNAYVTVEFKVIKEITSEDIEEELKDKKTNRAELLLAMYRSREELLKNKEYYNKIIQEQNRYTIECFIGINISTCLASNPNILEEFIYELSKSNVTKNLCYIIDNKTTPIKVVENIYRVCPSIRKDIREKIMNREDISEMLKESLERDKPKKKKTIFEKVCSIF